MLFDRRIAQSKFGIASVVLASNLALPSFAEGQQQEISFESVLAGFRVQQSLTQYNINLDKHRESLISRAAMTRNNPLALSIEAERGLQDQNERKITAIAKQKFAIGVNRDTLTERFSAYTEAERLAQAENIRQQEKKVAILYTNLRLQKEIATIAKETQSVLEPLVIKAKRAAEQGTLGGFFARRWQIFLGNVVSDAEEAETSFLSMLPTLTSATGIVATNDLELVNFPDFKNEAPTSFDERSYLPLAANFLRQKALVSQASDVMSRSEFSAGIGVARDLETRKDAIILEVEIPIFTRSIASSAAQEINTERAILGAESNLLTRQAKNRFSELSSHIRRNEDSLRIAAQRVQNLTKFHDDANVAFDQAKAEITEVVEILSELYEARKNLSTKQQDLAESIINLRYFMAGENT